MTDTGGTPNGRRYATVPCPRRPGSTLPLLGVAAEPEKYRPDQLSYTEAAQLARAREDAADILTGAHDGVQKSVTRLEKARHGAGAALQSYSVLLAEGRIRAAAEGRRRVLDEHRPDGPEDRRSRPRWQSAPVVWGLILISALYDTFFFANTFRVALDTSSDASRVERLIAYVPGIGIAIALLVAGALIGKPLFRHRSRAERRPRRGPLNWRVVFDRTFRTWRTGVDERAPDGLPWPSWPLPVAFLLLVLGVLGYWAWLRGEDESSRNERLQWPLVALLLLLTVSAILLKAIAENAFADRDQRSRRSLRLARWHSWFLERRARRRIAVLTTAWYRLQAVVDEAETAARRRLTDAWVAIAEAREQHQRTGGIAPAFAGVVADDRVDGPFFAGLAGPPLRTPMLDQGRELLGECVPERFHDQLEDLLRKAGYQWASVPRPTG